MEVIAPVSVRRQLIVELVRRLNATGSWSGATHIQKCVFFLRHMFDVDVGYDFVIYYYGPFSFDLDKDLVLLRFRGWLTVDREPGYGVHYRPGPKAPQPTDEMIEAVSPSIDRVAELFGKKGVKELELMATTYYVRKGLDGRSREEAEALTAISRLKPHFCVDEIREAWRELTRIERSLSMR